MIKTSRATAGLLGLLAACGCGATGSSDASAGSVPCLTVKDCNAHDSSRGQLCISGTCRHCSSDRQCSEAVEYGAQATCVLPAGECRSSSAGGAAGAGGFGHTGQPISAGNDAGVSGAAGHGGVVGQSSTLVDCGKGSARTASGACIACKESCTGLGETGTTYSVATAQGRCVCETAAGYFASPEGGIGTYPCDADNDGWVRDSAKLAIESSDSAIRDNARCALRQADRVVLRNEAEEEYTLFFTVQGPEVTESSADGGGTLPLYESVRNDEQGLLDGDLKVPPYGTASDAGSLRANEVNGFTKACVSAIGDHNDNGVADVEEWGRLPSGQVEVPTLGAGRDTFQALYARFSYFVELHDGWFEQTGMNPTGPGVLGRYVIREKQRAEGKSNRLALRYGLDANRLTYTSEFWQYCPRARDLGYRDTAAAVTYDFASVSGAEQVKASHNEWHGMMHHSQFKCVQIISDSEYALLVAGAAQNAALHRETTSSLTTLDWQPNQCALQGEPQSGSGSSVNPAVPTLNCEPMIASPSVGQVLWAAVRIAKIESYQRGCVNQCNGSSYLCPGRDPSLPVAPCYSMCADFSASSPLRIGSGSGTGYSLRGEVSRQTWGPLSAVDPAGSSVLGNPETGYSLRVAGGP